MKNRQKTGKFREKNNKKATQFSIMASYPNTNMTGYQPIKKGYILCSVH